MKDKKKCLSISSWEKDIQIKGRSLAEIPENERTPEVCFVAIHYWGAALEFVPNRYKTYELCLDAVRHNAPVDEGCSALAFVPEEFKTYELCLEAIKHDCITSIFWENHSVEPDYTAAINLVPEKLRTPELCFEAVKHSPYSPPGSFNFVENVLLGEYPSSDGPLPFYAPEIHPTSIQDILNSPDLFIKALMQIGMPDEYKDDALIYYEKIKKDKIN